MDAETFKDMFLPYHQKLYRAAYRIVQDVANAEDIVQDVYIKLWNKRSELGNIDNTEVFSMIILRNTCLDFLRKSKKNYQTTYDIDIPEKESLTYQIELKDNTNQVRRIINKLPEQQRQVVMMKHWDGYSDEEIELATGLSPGNIRVLLSRARKTIRERFVNIDL